MTFLALLFLLYLIYIFWMRHSIRFEPQTKLAIHEEVVFISVVIPLRDEANNLPALFESLREQHLGTQHFELIWINDHSEDESPNLIQNFIDGQSQLYQSMIHLEDDHGKKQAIKRGILQAQGNYILQIDADCTYPKHWLHSIFVDLKRSPADMLILPVHIRRNNRFLSAFDSLDYNSLQAISLGMIQAGYPILCSGANLLYSVQLGEEFYQSKHKTSSGDDIFLLQMALSKSATIRALFTPDTLAKSKAQENWTAFFEQRHRWVSKNTGVKDNLYLFVMILAWLINVGILYAFYKEPWYGLILLGIKTLADGELFITYYRKMNLQFPWIYYLISSILYPFYITYLTLTVIFTNSRWKGRNVVK